VDLWFLSLEDGGSGTFHADILDFVYSVEESEGESYGKDHDTAYKEQDANFDCDFSEHGFLRD
jgi:hypothetical protein